MRTTSCWNLISDKKCNGGVTVRCKMKGRGARSKDYVMANFEELEENALNLVPRPCKLLYKEFKMNFTFTLTWANEIC